MTINLYNPAQLTDLLRAASEAHHKHETALALGPDKDWASWYASWIFADAELKQEAAIEAQNKPSAVAFHYAIKEALYNGEVL